MTITIELLREHEKILKELAHKRGMAVEELARTAVIDLLQRPEEEFKAVVDRVLQRNAELYRRLA